VYQAKLVIWFYFIGGFAIAGVFVKIFWDQAVSRNEKIIKPRHRIRVFDWAPDWSSWNWDRSSGPKSVRDGKRKVKEFRVRAISTPFKRR